MSISPYERNIREYMRSVRIHTQPTNSCAVSRWDGCKSWTAYVTVHVEMSVSRFQRISRYYSFLRTRLKFEAEDIAAFVSGCQEPSIAETAIFMRV
jgi:hypothetical protein